MASAASTAIWEPHERPSFRQVKNGRLIFSSARIWQSLAGKWISPFGKMGEILTTSLKILKPPSLAEGVMGNLSSRTKDSRK